MDGGGGQGVLSYFTSSTSVNIDLETGVASGGDADGDVIIGDTFVFATGTGSDIISDVSINVDIVAISAGASQPRFRSQRLPAFEQRYWP
ncbi:hypothetical protein [Falsihalocynthiibacter arcticus]|uniref:hypothetical protein n=1 Tax=Falsihalocynthiibacter arcticus TaxID=1579316 RepID=UPI001F26E266|nr:hypothetical protein [Falsihalocynthiibacter arcticus]